MNNDFSEFKLQNRLRQIKHVLLVLSGKGGVGKSSVSVQLAISIIANNPNAKVGLLDVDLTGPSLPRMLGLEGSDVHMSDDGWVPVYLNATGPNNNGGGVLACMSIGFLLKNSRESVVWRGPKKNAMIKQFLGEVRWGDLDYLIVDTPPGTSDEHISLLESLRPLLLPQPPSLPPLPTLSSLLVSTPQAVALLDVSKELSFVRRTQLPLLGLIENMSGYVCPHCGDIVGVFGQGGAEDFCRIQEEKKHSKVEGEGGGCAFLGRVPIDPQLVGLLDDSVVLPPASLVDQSAQLAGDATGVEEGDMKNAEGRKSLVERYSQIPSFKIMKDLTAKVLTLIDEQHAQRDATPSA
ncbi:P-loop containing nucleoside triphosphate hydrolase protein [Meredithblackwellia eburnea MCA 4105]